MLITKTHEGRTPATYVALTLAGRLRVPDVHRRHCARCWVTRHDRGRGARRGVTRTFGGGRRARRRRRSSVGEGQLVGLLGPNGAGKTTLLRLVSGLRRPDSGTVRLFGGDPRDASSRIALGTTPQETGLPPTLRAGEVVDLVGGHYPAPDDPGELLARFGLEDLVARQTGGLSGGQKRRLAVALALVGRPRLVLLDEPTTGLDVEARHVLWQALRDYHADGATVLLTSHYLEEIEALAERVVVDRRRSRAGRRHPRRRCSVSSRCAGWSCRCRRADRRPRAAARCHQRVSGLRTGAGRVLAHRRRRGWCARSSRRTCRSRPGAARAPRWRRRSCADRRTQEAVR